MIMKDVAERLRALNVSLTLRYHRGFCIAVIGNNRAVCKGSDPAPAVEAALVAEEYDAEEDRNADDFEERVACAAKLSVDTPPPVDAYDNGPPPEAVSTEKLS